MLALFGVAAWIVSIAAAPKLPDKPVGTEVAFVHSVQTTLNSLYPTEAAAEKAGYFRYTNVDETGAISYVNPSYWKSDLQHPSQLWYSAKGELLGADYSLPYAGPAPKIWGVNPARWGKFGAHVHWVTKDASGNMKYGQATSLAKFKAAGGDPSNPSAATVVKMGRVKDASSVVHIFAFPDLWDMELWVKNNPNGAFADSNPLVPVPKKGTGMGM
ncbi:MAG TPA: hypothetical protein VGZ02_02460 [Candidatus Baltobacteraceae bacterium]|jgi:hypothetical protein|nr:hypothetical protein [Candidatus Baltobacteraceae bacterium]